MRSFVASIEGEFRRYKLLGDGSIGQLSEAELTQADAATGNSVATLVWHISGNLVSRFTDFLASDGEKPWRNREAEFGRRSLTGEELAKEIRGDGWRWLTIPPGGTAAYNKNPVRERAPGPAR